MTPRKKPTCEKFIIAAIRKLRRHPTNLKDGKTGVAIKRLWPVVQSKYTEEEFRIALNKLLAADDITLLVTIAYAIEGPKHQRWKELPQGASLTGAWLRNRYGTTLLHRTDGDKDVERIRSMHAYVTEDGFPHSIKKLLGRSSTSQEVADSIIADLE